MFYKEERLALFIDGASLYGAGRALGFDIDFRRLFNLFARKGRLVRAFYYTTVVEDQEYSPLRPLIDWLEYHSYTTVTKPQREYTDSRDRLRIRSSIHVDLAIDALRMADQVDHIILMSGDGEFLRLVAAIQRRGVRVTVASSLQTSPPLVSDELRRQADGFLEIADLVPEIQRLRLSDPDAAAADDEADKAKRGR
ncbi:NYN domain-containing protein [Inquilinus ginsengisoli]|uniref:LabA-like NYN domain-containing protein n=1 Tax=Inquilinus ginsengisoli TaxID=363840 RepID=UPI003D2261AE